MVMQVLQIIAYKHTFVHANAWEYFFGGDNTFTHFLKVPLIEFVFMQILRGIPLEIHVFELHS